MVNADNFQVKFTRLATLKDVDRVMELSEQLAKETSYRDIPVDKKKLRELVESVIVSSPKRTVLLVSVDESDYIVGFIAGVPIETAFSTVPMSMEIGWWVSPDANSLKRRYLELRAGYEEWARRRGHHYVQYAVLNPSEKDLRLLEADKDTNILELVYHRKIDQAEEK